VNAAKAPEGVEDATGGSRVDVARSRETVTERLAGEWGKPDIAPPPLRPTDSPPFALAWLRYHEEAAELCVQPRNGKLQVFRISTGSAGGLLRSAAEVVTRKYR
jgi:hypothetical protein